MARTDLCGIAYLFDATLMGMEITRVMMQAARQAEFTHRQQSGCDSPTPLTDALMRAIIDAAISAIGEDDELEAVAEPVPVEQPSSQPVPTSVRIVRASKPKPKPRPDR